jgi:hydrogenase nickel incorporation protein HypA/HybF
VARGTPLEGARLELRDVPAAGRCRACGTEARLGGFPLRCPACGALDVELTAGEELCVEAIEVDEMAAIGGR